MRAALQSTLTARDRHRSCIRDYALARIVWRSCTGIINHGFRGLRRCFYPCPSVTSVVYLQGAVPSPAVAPSPGILAGDFESMNLGLPNQMLDRMTRSATGRLFRCERSWRAPRHWSAWRCATTVRIVFQIVLCVAAGFAFFGCSTPQAQCREQFLISHGFHREERDTYTRHYDSLSEASRHIGFSIHSAFIPPNGPPFGPDVRVFDLNGWGFVVTADQGRTLDDLGAPCTVGTAVAQVQRDKEMPKGFR